MAYDFIDCVGDDVDVVSDSEVCADSKDVKFCFLVQPLMIFTVFILFFLLQSCTEHQEASQDSLQQVPRQYGRAQSREDIAAGRTGHPGAVYELLQGQHTYYIFTVSCRHNSTLQC